MSSFSQCAPIKIGLSTGHYRKKLQAKTFVPSAFLTFRRRRDYGAGLSDAHRRAFDQLITTTIEGGASMSGVSIRNRWPSVDTA
jgi:hypothetical protein